MCNWVNLVPVSSVQFVRCEHGSTVTAVPLWTDETVGLRRMVPSSYLSSSAGEPINMSLLVIYLWLALVAIMVVITVICFKYKRPVNRPLTCSLVRLAFRSSVLLRWLCDTFCTSGFMNNAMFVHNGREGDAKQTYTQSDSTGGSTDLTPRRILRLTHQGQHRGGGGVCYLRDCVVFAVGGGESPVYISAVLSTSSVSRRRRGQHAAITLARMTSHHVRAAAAADDAMTVTQ